MIGCYRTQPFGNKKLKTWISPVLSSSMRTYDSLQAPMSQEKHSLGARGNHKGKTTCPVTSIETPLMFKVDYKGTKISYEFENTTWRNVVHKYYLKSVE